jgi:hypothetical protein
MEVDSKRWLHRVPERFCDQAPRLVRTATGGDAWAVAGQPPREAPSDLYGGKGRDCWRPFGPDEERRKMVAGNCVEFFKLDTV